MTTRLALSILVVSLTWAGCVADTGESATGLPQGLSVLDAEEGALALAYRSADVVIYMEALRGQPTPDRYQEDPASPDFEVDALFTDDQGFVFFSQKGGDAFSDATWQARIDDQRASPLPDHSNEVLYRLSAEAAAVMRDEIAAQVGPELAAALEPEISALYEFGVRAPGIYEEQMDIINAERVAEGLPLIELEGSDGDVAYGNTDGVEGIDAEYGRDDYRLDLHHASIDYSGGDGMHSATVLYRWAETVVRGKKVSGGEFLATYSTCNHGGCATNIAKKCGFEKRTLEYAKQLNCSGEYKWDSDGGYYGHNCHDDSRTQMYNFIYDATAGGHWRWCNGNDDDTDISVDIWGVELDQAGSPTCDGNGRRGYGWAP